MTQYRGGFTVTTDSAFSDETIGALMDALKRYDGALSVEGDRLSIVFSFDASDLPGFASGLTAAIPRIAGIARNLLGGTGLLGAGVTVVGLSVERVDEPIPF